MLHLLSILLIGGTCLGSMVVFPYKLAQMYFGNKNDRKKNMSTFVLAYAIFLITQNLLSLL